MEHPYKEQLSQYLQFIFPDHQVINQFETDEIIIVLRTVQNTKKFIAVLPQLLEELPDIDHPAERTIINCCDLQGNDNQVILLHPTRQDTFNHALIGKIKSSKIDLEALLYKQPIA